MIKKIDIPYIDWITTGERLKQLRIRNDNLCRNVCRILSEDTTDKTHQCDKLNCSSCQSVDWQISQEELARVFKVSNDVISNWEKGTTIIPIEYLIMYCDLCNIDRTDILSLLVFTK